MGREGSEVPPLYFYSFHQHLRFAFVPKLPPWSISRRFSSPSYKIRVWVDSRLVVTYIGMAFTTH